MGAFDCGGAWPVAHEDALAVSGVKLARRVNTCVCNPGLVLQMHRSLGIQPSSLVVVAGQLLWEVVVTSFG